MTHWFSSSSLWNTISPVSGSLIHRFSGISRRPIHTIAFDDELAEVFFEDVRVPLANVVGDIGDGWSVATGLLDEERLLLGNPSIAQRAIERLRRLVRLGRLTPDERLADRIARAEIEIEVLTSCFLNLSEQALRGEQGADASYLKLLATETTQFILDVVQDAAGEWAALRSPPSLQGERVDINEMFLQSRRLSIYGGSSEIQKTIIAGRTLGLPR